MAQKAFMIISMKTHRTYKLYQILAITAAALWCAACSTQPSTSSQLATNNTMPKLQQQFNEWQGVPYLYGGSSKSGIDCSAFVQNTFAQHFNIQLARTTKAQRKQSQRIDIKNAQAGDLLFFKTGFKAWHVGIYMENNKFMHASTSKGVIISSLNSSYWYNAFVEARRIN